MLHQSQDHGYQLHKDQVPRLVLHTVSEGQMVELDTLHDGEHHAMKVSSEFVYSALKKKELHILGLYILL
jgi:hypothetical protein